MPADSGLANLFVLELSRTPGAAFAASLLADFGAEVVVCEPPAGTALRGLGPDGGVLWKILARNKKSIILDPNDAARLEHLISQADILITDRAAPERVGEPLLETWQRAAESRRPLLVEVFPTGADRPDLWPWGLRSEFAAACAGMMALTGEERGAPRQPEAPIADYLAGALAATRALTALRRAHLCNNPQAPISVPLHQAVQRLIEWQLPVASAQGAPELRRGNSFPMNAGIANMHRTADGVYVAISAVTQVTAERLLTMVGGDALRTDPRFATTAARQSDLAALYKVIDAWIGARRLTDVQAAAAAHDVVLGPVFTTAEILRDAHMAARGSHETVAGIIMPRVFPRIDGLATSIRTLGPDIGAHTAELLTRPAGGRPAPRTAAVSLKPFRVLDLGTVIAGPVAGSLLAELGGEVIKIEAPGEGPQAGDPLRHMGPKKNGVPLWFGVSARAKRCVTLNLKDPEGKDLFRRMLAEADVVVENYRPGVLERLGFDWQTMQAINPRLIQLSISGFGQTGPDAGRPGFGKIAEGMSGVVSLTGQRGDTPLFVGFSLADACAGLFGAFAVSLCLYRRDVQDRGGARIDLALYEPLLRMLDCQLALHAATGHATMRGGTDDPYGFGNPPNHRSCFQSIQTADGAWYFAAVPDVLNHSDKQTAAALRSAVDAAGGVMVPVFEGASLASSPYFAARGDVVRATVPNLGELSVPGPIEAGTAPAFRAPALGEDNAAVYGALGLSGADLERLRGCGVI